MSSFSTAQLTIFAVLALPTLFILYKHRGPGFLGWLYLLIFCMLRIIGGAMALNGSKTASIIQNIGLSPLLLATAGILHEIRHYTTRDYNRKLEWLMTIVYHHLVIAGVVLLAIGSSALQSDDATPDSMDSNLKLVKAGIAVLTVSWFILVGWTIFTGIANRRIGGFSCIAEPASLLLVCCMIALVFTGIRVLYSLVALTTQNPSINPSTGNLAVRVVLGLLPELLSAVVLVIGGLMTRNLAADAKKT